MIRVGRDPSNGVAAIRVGAVAVLLAGLVGGVAAARGRPATGRPGGRPARTAAEQFPQITFRPPPTAPPYANPTVPPPYAGPGRSSRRPPPAAGAAPTGGWPGTGGPLPPPSPPPPLSERPPRGQRRRMTVTTRP